MVSSISTKLQNNGQDRGGIRNDFGGIRWGCAGDPRGIRMPLKGILGQKLLYMTHFLHTTKGIRVRAVTLIIILKKVN